MRKSILAVVLALVVLAAFGVRANTGARVTGVVSAADHEVSEGYFALSPETTLLVKPGSRMHDWLRSRMGQRVVLTIEPDAASE